MNGPGMDPNQNDPFTAKTGSPHQTDFSAYEDPLPDVGGTDAETIKKINRRTSPFGRVVGALIIVGSIGLGYWAYESSVAYDSRMEPLQEAAKLEGEARLAALRDAYAKARHEDVKERILLNLGAFGDKQSIPLMVDALNEKGIVRRAAARALAHLGSPAADVAKPKLLEVLPKTDARDRAQVVWALAVLGEQAAVPDILAEFAAGHLQNLEDLNGEQSFDPKVIVDVVGPQQLASDELITHKDKAVRTLVAVALSEAATPDVVDPLIKLLDDEDTEVVRAAAAGLGRTGDPRAAQPLFDLLKRKAFMRQSILDAIGRSTAAPDVAKLLDKTDSVDLQRSLVSMLKDMHDPRVADTFAKLLDSEDGDIKQTAAIALAELGDVRASTVLLDLAESEERSTALDALDALALIAKPDIGKMLVPLLKDNPGRKASILKAIGKSGAESAGPAVMAELEGDDIETAAYALGDLKYAPAYKKLLDMVKKPKDVDFSKPSVATEEIVRNREIAMRALGRYGRPDAIPALVTIIEDQGDALKLRATAGAVLGQLADQAALTDIVAKAKNNALDEDTRTFYVQGLWQADAQTISGQLVDLLQPSIPASVRRSAALAIGYAADPANDQLLTDLLRNQEVKREAAFAVILGGNETASQELIEQLKADRELREVLQDVLMADDSDYFNLVSERHFSNGEVFRRLKVAKALKEGDGETTFSYPWQQVIARLKAGWGGPGGLSPREIRAKLYEALRGDEPQKRALAAEALGAMGERGLLLASRDEPGPGQEEARAVLLRQNRG